MSSSTVKTLTGNIPATTAKDAWFTTLCTHKDDADRINASRLMQVKLRVHHQGVCMSRDLHFLLQLSSESHLFEAQDKGSRSDLGAEMEDSEDSAEAAEGQCEEYKAEFLCLSPPSPALPRAGALAGGREGVLKGLASHQAEANETRVLELE